VERAGVLRWLKSTGRDSLMAEAVKMWELEDLYHAKMFAARIKLSNLFKSYNKKEDSLLLKKDSMLIEFTNEFGPSRFGKINNAFFVPANTYYSLVPKFQNLLDSLGDDFAQFYIEAKNLGPN